MALINRRPLIFTCLNIDPQDVLRAAGPDWNFLPLRAGLVGVHCVGVDPDFLTHKSEKTGYRPEMILAGRRLNDGMGIHVADEVVRLMSGKRIKVKGSPVLVLGLASKENRPDGRL